MKVRKIGLLDISIVFLIGIYVGLLLLCENTWVGWMVAGINIVGYLSIRCEFVKCFCENSRHKKWFCLLLVGLNIFIGLTTTQVSFQGAIISKIVVPIMTPEFAKPMLLNKEDSNAANEVIFNESWEKEGYVHEKFTKENVKIEKIYAQNSSNKKVVMEIHGGAFVVGLKSSYRDMAVKICDIYEDTMVVLPDYTTSEDEPYPEALNDCVATYEWILEQGYKSEDIIIIGDSAGGNLALALGLYLRDNSRPQPAGIITISAFANHKCDTESYYKNADKCILGNWFGAGRFNVDDFFYLEGHIDELDNPYISPVYGSYENFPKLLMQVGGREIVLDDSVTITDKVNKAGGEATLTVYRGMWHVFQVIGIDFPEAIAAWEEIGGFIMEVWK